MSDQMKYSGTGTRIQVCTHVSLRELSGLHHSPDYRWRLLAIKDASRQGNSWTLVILCMEQWTSIKLLVRTSANMDCWTGGWHAWIGTKYLWTVDTRHFPAIEFSFPPTRNASSQICAKHGVSRTNSDDLLH